MPQINASAFLKALESESFDTAVAMAAGTPVDPPAVGPETAEPAGAILTPADEQGLFLTMLSQSMGPDNFASFITEHAIDLEVYGLVTSANMVRDSVAALRADSGASGSGMIAAMVLLGKHANNAAADAYVAACDAQQRALANLMETYSEEAKTLVRGVLEGAKAKAAPMTNHCGEILRMEIEKILRTM